MASQSPSGQVYLSSQAHLTLLDDFTSGTSHLNKTSNLSLQTKSPQYGALQAGRNYQPTPSSSRRSRRLLRPSRRCHQRYIILPLRSPSIGIPPFTKFSTNRITDLTGISPTPQQQPQPEDSEHESTEAPEPSLAGTTHPLPLSTPYYTASIPIWLDLISSPSEWSTSFLSEEAKEVLGVLGGVVCVFEVPSSSSKSQTSSAQKERTKNLVESVGKVVREGLGGWEWEGVGLAVGVTSLTGNETEVDMEDQINEWDDLCAEWGLEFVHHQITPNSGVKGKDKKEEEKRNEYGEKMGIARVLEALQSNDWSGGDSTATQDNGPLDDSEEEEYIDPNDWDTEDEFDLGFGYTRKQKAEMRKAFWKGTETSDKSTEEDLKAFRNVTQSVDGSRGDAWDARMKSQAREGFWKQFEEEVMEKMKNNGEGKKSATGAAKAGPSAVSGSGAGAGADKVKKEPQDDEEEEEIGEEDVEKIAKMMMKLQAVRDMSGSMPEEQRRKLAMKAVEEVMREL